MISAIGQDSHRFEEKASGKILRLAGVDFPNMVALEGNSDADVVLHALCNAISGVSGVNILGAKTDEMCQSGIRDSREYVKEAVKTLGVQRVRHVSVSIEAKTPKISPRIHEMKSSIANLCNISANRVGITATTGEGLTDFGRGLGIQAFVIVNVEE